MKLAYYDLTSAGHKSVFPRKPGESTKDYENRFFREIRGLGVVGIESLSGDRAATNQTGDLNHVQNL